MDKIQLNNEWTLAEPIGEGGFGKVYAASSAGQASAVVKLVPRTPGADRELLMADMGGARNVVPIIDSGVAGNCWALVMPRADRSLRDHLDLLGGPLNVGEAVGVLCDIATALADLDGRVVHRDLKPENVLLLDGRWCLADFGISRYAEAATAPNTRKYAMSPPYASPERWRSQRATIATDVYSLGVLAYEVLANRLPFPGPTWEDFRDQHLHQEAPHLEGVPTALAALVGECLYKPAGPRPSPANLLARLARIVDEPRSLGLAKLQEANRAEVSRRGQAGRRGSERQSETERIAGLATIARPTLQQVAEALKDAITQAAPAARFTAGALSEWTAALGQAELRFEPPTITPQAPWGRQPPAFEVISHSALSITVPPNRGYEGRSHSLWFCDAKEPGRYQWFETAFMTSPLAREFNRHDPYALAPGPVAAAALAAGLSTAQVAWPFSVVSAADLDEFIGRWASWFADASQGQLNRPSSMPERSPQGSWRRI